MEFVRVNDYALLLKIKVEDSIIDYILHLRKLKLSSSTIRTRISALYHFYAMNDIILNKTKINKYKGEFTKVVKDRSYSHEEIHKLLDIADLRMKVCILLMASAGLRLGSIPDLKIKHLKKMQNIYRIIVYEGFNEEYFTFCTPECAKAIDEYINYRARNGEKVTSEAHLIREHFDDYAPKQARAITKDTIRETIDKLLIKSGLKTRDHLSKKHKAVPMTHGFRKFFTTQLIEADLKTELRWLLEGHNLKGNDSSYIRTTEKRLQQEYEKAINYLTINEENRLKEKVDNLTSELKITASLIERIEKLEKNRG